MVHGPAVRHLPRRRLAVGVVAACLILAVATPLASQAPQTCPVPLHSLVPDAPTRELLLQGGVQRPLGAGEAPRLAPRVADADRLASIRTLDTVYGAELLRLLPVPAFRLCDLLGIYNALQSVSALEGIEYFSQSRNRNRILYRASYFVSAVTNREPLPDPEVSAIPASNASLLFQDDTTFGRNVYQAEYLFEPNIVTLRLRNLTTMWWSIFPLVRPENFRTVIVVTPTDAGLLFYAVTAIRAANVGFIRERGQVSLSNRLDALERWLRGQLGEV
jgi:hypothetical protein